jgi:hypothetical protein
MNKYVEIANCGYNKNFFTIEDNHIKEIKLIWCREDIKGRAKDLDMFLTDDKIDEVLYILVNKHDACYGVTWDTIDFWIEEVFNS